MHTYFANLAIIIIVKPPQYNIYIKFLLHPIRTNTFSLKGQRSDSCPFFMLVKSCLSLFYLHSFQWWFKIRCSLKLTTKEAKE
jgi:hypothetical protein